jgi:hypothetical protein
MLRTTFKSDKLQNYGTAKIFRSRLSLKQISASFSTNGTAALSPAFLDDVIQPEPQRNQKQNFL